MDTMTLQRDTAPWYKHRWPWFLIAGPALVVVAALITLWLAATTNNDLVSDDYYKEGLAINQELQRAREAGALGLRADVMRSGQNVRLILSASGETPLPPTLVLRLTHPTQAAQDEVVEMVSGGAGFYDGKLNADLTGRWLASIEDPSGQWRLQGVWQADSEGSLSLQAKAKK
ncbi:MAG: FixH family protein [Azonexus sp.]|nr:FixH family protein [Azonexus sp.]